VGIEELISLHNRACGPRLNVAVIAFVYSEHAKVLGVCSSFSVKLINPLSKQHDELFTSSFRSADCYALIKIRSSVRTKSKADGQPLSTRRFCSKKRNLVCECLYVNRYFIVAIVEKCRCRT
jgi:hypothetical protein